MSLIIMRSARSPLLKEAGDLSSALTDARGRLIAQGRDIPIHLGVMGFTVKEFLRRVPRRELRDGDVLVPEPPRGRRQPPAGREGDPAGVRGRAARRLRHQPRPLGRHRRRGPRLVRAVGGRGHPGGAPDRADQGLRPEGARRGPSTSSWRTSGAGRSARATAARMYSAVEVGGPAPRRALRPLRRADHPRLLRPLPGRVGGRRCGPPSARSPTASTRARTGSTTTATRTGRCRSG